jgi:methyl-accepting chemotaxis protein
MSSMTKQNADNAEQGKSLASQARSSADFGANEMKGMSQAMNDIKNASDGISRIIKTIDEIAFQTNILALNAAVEAARAGEAGMGFAVVADEVRNLAQRSAQAAKETAAKIEDSIQKSERGVQISVKVEQALAEILTRVRQVDDLSAEIASASKEQRQGIEQLNTAVSEMDKVTQTTAATAEESASTAEELNSQARILKGVVEDLIRLTGASNVSAKQDGISHASASAAKEPDHEPSMKKHGAKNGKNGANLLFNNRKPAPLQQISTTKDNFKDF